MHAYDLPPVILTASQFIIKGAVYQNNYIRARTAAQEQGSENSKAPRSPQLSDPIADDQIEVLSCSIPLLQELGINTLLVCTLVACPRPLVPLILEPPD